MLSNFLFPDGQKKRRYIFLFFLQRPNSQNKHIEDLLEILMEIALLGLMFIADS